MVREVLEVFVRVCIFLDQPMFLSFVFKAISNRLDYVSSAHAVPFHKMYLYIFITNCRQYCFGLLGLISAVLKI